jgi:hypothetical protein
VEAARLPLVPRTLNFVARQLDRLGLPLVRLEAEELITSARRRSGLSELGDEGFREPLSILLRSVLEEGRLSALGRLMARQELLRNLENRLQLTDWQRRYPEIAEGRVRRPIVIVGQGRTGTTILHELMTLDPANRMPLTWETESPCPPPERVTYETDPRIEGSQRKLDRSESLIPDFKRIHRMGAQLPQECMRITSIEFSSLMFSAMWRVPSYTRWLFDEAQHRRVLQLLQWRCPGERWVLKSPGHLWHLPELVAEYPDARLVQTHRDPLQILSSLTSLEVVLRSMASEGVDAHAIAREWSEWNALGYERVVAFRERGLIPASQVIDVQFSEFIRDPVLEVRRIYDHLDLELDREVEGRMRAYVAANPSSRDGKHVHRFADTRLDIDEEREKVRRYQEYFGVESEPGL